MQHMQVDSFFSQYSQHPKWKQLAESLIGESASCDAPEWFNKPPGEEAPTPPHQNNYYFCLAPPNVITIWMALDRVNDQGPSQRDASKSSLLKG